MRLFVIEEKTPAGKIALVRRDYTDNTLVVFENKRGAKDWLAILDKARGQKSTPPPYFGKSKFRIIELQEVK